MLPSSFGISPPHEGLTQDCCRQDVWREELGHACLHKCTCPQDGGPCTVPGSCDASSFVCQAGYRRFSTGEARCYPEGCPEGTLQVSLHVCSMQSVRDGCSACVAGTEYHCCLVLRQRQAGAEVYQNTLWTQPMIIECRLCLSACFQSNNYEAW